MSSRSLRMVRLAAKLPLIDPVSSESEEEVASESSEFIPSSFGGDTTSDVLSPFTPVIDHVASIPCSPTVKEYQDISFSYVQHSVVLNCDLTTTHHQIIDNSVNPYITNDYQTKEISQMHTPLISTSSSVTDSQEISFSHIQEPLKTPGSCFMNFQPQIQEPVTLNSSSIIDCQTDFSLEKQKSITSGSFSVNHQDNSQYQKRIRRKHTCPFCNVTVGNFARHLERNHNDEISVQEFISLDKKSTKRIKLIDKLRKEGDFCTASVIPVLSQNKLENEFIACKFCKGYYSKVALRRHAKRCYFNPNPFKKFNAQVEGQTIMAGPFGPNDILRTSGLLNMLRADDISMVVKKDYLICEVGRRYIRSHKERHLLVVAKRNMRRLARLLITARRIDSNNKIKLDDILTPTNFKLIVKATKEIAGYDERNRSYESPSLALQMGTIIKSAVNTAYSMEIQKQCPVIKKIEELKDFNILIQTDWAHEVSSEAGQHLAINKYNKPSLIPLTEDIAKFNKYLQNKIKQSKVKLSADLTNLKAYKDLLETVFCSLLLFNKRRVGELQRINIISFSHHSNKPTMPTDFEKVLSESEKILYRSLKRIVIRGKRGRGVPVLFDRELLDSIDTLIDSRKNFNFAENYYLFGLPGTDNPIFGSAVMRKHAKMALGDANKASLLTSTRLRKHLATMVQILKMDKHELEQLATFLGHTSQTHSQFYRLPDDIYQTAKVSKLLMMAKSTTIENYKGKCLDEIDIGDDLVEDAGEDDDEEIILDHNNVNIDSPTTSYDLEITSEKENKGEKIKRTLVPWTDKQKSTVETFFKNHIINKIPPKKHEIMRLTQKYPGIFHNKSWTVIKVFVQNKYKK